jgi:hypothetical protein
MDSANGYTKRHSERITGDWTGHCRKSPSRRNAPLEPHPGAGPPNCVTLANQVDMTKLMHAGFRDTRYRLIISAILWLTNARARQAPVATRRLRQRYDASTAG